MNASLIGRAQLWAQLDVLARAIARVGADKFVARYMAGWYPSPSIADDLMALTKQARPYMHSA